MTNLRFIFGDQLNLNISSLRDLDLHEDLLFFFEGMEEFTQVKLGLPVPGVPHFCERLST